MSCHFILRLQRTLEGSLSAVHVQNRQNLARNLGSLEDAGEGVAARIHDEALPMSALEDQDVTSNLAARIVLGRAGSHKGNLARTGSVDLDRNQRVSAGIGREGIFAGADIEVGGGDGHGEVSLVVG